MPTDPTDPDLGEGVSLPNLEIFTSVTVSGIMDVVVQLSDIGTDFTLADGSLITLSVSDTKGSIIAIKISELVDVNGDTFRVSFPFNFNSVSLIMKSIG